MGDERADRDSDSARGGSDETAREVTVTRLKRENERLRDRLEERRDERDRIVERYETLLDAARAEDDRTGSKRTDRSVVGRLIDRLRDA